MLLYFLKTHVRELHDDSARQLLKNDFRVQALIGMIMERYTPNIDFAYQLSTVISLTTLQSFFDLSLTDTWKNKLVECLSDADIAEQEGGAFISEVPNLIFCLNGLSTSENIDSLRGLVEGLSMVYLQVSGERIDIHSASNLLFALTETNVFNPELFERIIKLCLEKDKAGAFYLDGCSTELVNIVKSYQELHLQNDDFLDMILGHTVHCFNDLNLSWVAILLKALSQSKCDADLAARHFVELTQLLHKKLQLGFEKKSAAQNVAAGSKSNRYEQVPDLYDYAQLWLCL